MTKRCICEICTCGKHKCPHQPKSNLSQGAGPCQLTEYTNTYKPHPLQARESFKPAQAPMQGGQFQDKTTQRTDFKAHPVERPQFHQPDQYVKPQGEMDTNTSYKQEYTEKHGIPAKAIRNEGQRMIPARFEGEPTYKSDYRKWEAAGRPQAYGIQAAWQPPQSRFEGQTTFQHDFRRNEIQPRQSYKPLEGAKMSDTPLEDRTSHRDAYVPHAMPARYVHPKEEYKPSGAQFDGMSTFKRDYKGQPGQPMQSFKPEGRAFISEAPFEDGTTNRHDYKQWPIEKPYVHAHEQYRRPEGEMEMNTTHKATYKEMPIERQVARRPASVRKTDAPFDGITNYSQDYRKWEGERARMPKQPDYIPNTAPFEGQTTFQHDFRRNEIQPRQSYKPLEGAKMSDTPLEDRTSHRDAYVPHAMPARYVHPKEEYKPSGAQFDGMSTFKRDYKGQPGQPMQSFKPEGRAFISEAPFEDGTTNRHDYKQWPIEKPYVHAHEQYRRPEGEMEMNTTHKATYKEMPIERQVARRPASVRKTDAPFDGITNYSQDYRKWEGERARMPKQPDYIPNTAPFEGNSTYKGHYVPHAADRTRSFRPDNTAFRSDARFEDSTMYRQDYVPKPIQICEAINIGQPTSRYRFAEHDNRGHRLYETTITPLQTNGPTHSQQRLVMSVA